MKVSDRSTSDRAADKAPACPVCRSVAVTTAAKPPDVNSYWRCEACGEVWNVERRRRSPR
jgi:transposase-like protein